MTLLRRWWPELVLLAAFAGLTAVWWTGHWLGVDVTVTHWCDAHRPPVADWLARKGNYLGQGGWRSYTPNYGLFGPYPTIQSAAFFGATNSPVQSGSVMQSGVLTPVPRVTIGGVVAVVQFAGLVGPGEFQFNVVVPAGLGNGDQAIVATYNGASTQTGTLLTVHN